MNQTKHPVTGTQEWLDTQGVTFELMQGVDIDRVFETYTQSMPGAATMYSDALVFSVKPDGEPLLLHLFQIPRLAKTDR